MGQGSQSGWFYSEEDEEHDATSVCLAFLGVF